MARMAQLVCVCAALMALAAGTSPEQTDSSTATADHGTADSSTATADHGTTDSSTATADSHGSTDDGHGTTDSGHQSADDGHESTDDGHESTDDGHESTDSTTDARPPRGHDNAEDTSVEWWVFLVLGVFFVLIAAVCAKLATSGAKPGPESVALLEQEEAEHPYVPVPRTCLPDGTPPAVRQWGDVELGGERAAAPPPSEAPLDTSLRSMTPPPSGGYAPPAPQPMLAPPPRAPHPMVASPRAPQIPYASPLSPASPAAAMARLQDSLRALESPSAASPAAAAGGAGAAMARLQDSLKALEAQDRSAFAGRAPKDRARMCTLPDPGQPGERSGEVLSRTMI